MPDAPSERGPVIEYLLKEVSFSTCDDKFFGELEPEMLIPNNLNIHGRISGAETLRDYELHAEFPEDTALAYLKAPKTNTVKNGKRLLTYMLEDLVNYEDYWWLPLPGETEFVLPLNLLPPFPKLNPVDLKISCNPDVAVGVDTYVTTTIGLQAEQHVDNLFLTFSAPPYRDPGMQVTISAFSGDDIQEPRQSVSVPKKEFPFPRVSMKPGETKEYKVRTRIKADLTGMTRLKCQHNLLHTKLVLLSESSPTEPPCSISVISGNGDPVPVKRTERSTLLTAQAQIMYTPFSIRREEQRSKEPEQRLVQATAPA
jgi:hypothetical protein